MMDELAPLLDHVSNLVDKGFIPPQTTILALRRLNGAFARLCSTKGLVVDDNGNVTSVGGKGPSLDIA